MKIIDRAAYDEIRIWMHRNAREIDLAVWKFLFENGNAEGVLSALSAYQNADGGFGNALEPDSWNPGSSPYTTLCAAGKLEAIDFTDSNHQIIRGILKFLESGAHRTENGWLFNIPGNDAYAHAPWWGYDPEANQTEHLGVTAGLVCFVLKFAEKKSSLYEMAFSFAEKLLKSFEEPGGKGDMGLTGYRMLLEHIVELKLDDKLNISYLSKNIKKNVDEAIVRDVSQWPEYSVKPSQFIESPESPFYAGNEDIVEKELDYLIETRPAGGVWGITWSWHENYNKYPKEFAISENWWKASIATGTMTFLKKFGRIK